MRSSRTAATAIPALLLAAGLTACTSSTSGHGGSSSSGSGGSSGATSTGSSAASSASSSASSPVSSSAPATSAAPPAGNARALAGVLQSAMAKVHSLHLSLTTAAGAVRVTASGDEQLTAGKITAFDLRENVASQTLRIISAGNKTYVQLPASLRKSSKPFSLVTANSTNPTVKLLATSLASTLSSSSLSSYGAFVQAASSVRSRGRTTVGGQSVTHYSVVVDVTRLPASLPNGTALKASGLKSLPIEMYVDSQGRLVEITEVFTASGQHVTVQVLVTRYNQPVHIVAPPASQVDLSK